jgi:hypothetical protein
MRVRASLCSLAAAAILAACGGGNDAGDAPDPREPVSRFASRVQAALTQRGCPKLREINVDAQVVLPCPASDPRARQGFANFRVTGSKEYGTGGVIDFTDAEAPRGGTFIVALGTDRNWVIVGQLPFGTSRAPQRNRADFEKAVEQFLPAVRNRNCDEFFKYSVTQSQTKEQACSQELGRPYDDLRRALRASDDTEPFYLGGNGHVVFFGLLTDEPSEQYRTIPVIRMGAGGTSPYMVLTTARL